MEKKYVVRLSEEEKKVLTDVLKKFKGSPQKIRRAQILLKADVNGPNWKDKEIAEAFGCRTQTAENVRQQLVTEGFEVALSGRKRAKPPRGKILDGEQEAQLIAMRLGDPPTGYGGWSLRLLRDQVIELKIVESISHETVRTTLKKTKLQRETYNIG